MDLDDTVDRAADVKLTGAQMARLDEASALDLGYPYAMIGRIGGRW